MHRYEHLRRIAHLTQSLARHLEDSQFGCGSETVLYAPEKTVCTPVVALELEHDVHYMFQNLRPGDASFLRDMSYEDDRHTCLLGKTQKHRSSLLDLGN